MLEHSLGEAVKKRKRDYARQIEEGVWYPLLGWDFEMCCDCALVHRQQFRVKDGKLEFRAFRDDKATRALRAKQKILVLKG